MESSRTTRLALGAIVETPTGLAWAPGALERILAALDEEIEGPGGLAILDQLLRLAVVLREREAGALADDLGALIRSSKPARALLERKVGRARTIDAARGFAQSEGREVHVRAPSTRDERPAGSLKLSSLVDPLGRDRHRVQSHARKNAKQGGKVD